MIVYKIDILCCLTSYLSIYYNSLQTIDSIDNHIKIGLTKYTENERIQSAVDKIQQKVRKTRYNLQESISNK